MTWLETLDRQSRSMLAMASILLAMFIGFFDYVTGTHISLSAFYLLPISLAAWFIGPQFALLISVWCAAIWIAAGAFAGDEDFTNPFVAGWNGAVELASFVVVVAVLTRLRELQRGLEARVRDRAAALTREIAERERLQKELLDVSEQEQRRIGQDLHDGLCQHLAGTAIAGQVLREKLAQKQLAEAADAGKVVTLIEEGVMLSRKSAKGLHPVELDAEGLMFALEEFAATTSRLFKVDCRFDCESPVLIHSAATAEHMFRIVQEAVRNAINHGHAEAISVQLNTLEDGQELRIEDDGEGLPPVIPQRAGMGLRIMGHRARMIGATLEVKSRPQGGTVVACMLPLAADTELV
jgi:signal transduction histidine kinase